MTGPTTQAGKELAAFLRGLLPETRQFVGQIARIEQEAAEQEAEKCDETVQALQDCGRDLFAVEALADQLAKALRRYIVLWHGCDRHGGEWNECEYCDRAALAAHEEARK